MKCKSCSCRVSSEFTHAFTTNCCPKCGASLMTEDVKHLFAKIDRVLTQQDNDIGDLAIWFVDNYFKKTEPEIQLSLPDQPLLTEVIEEYHNTSSQIIESQEMVRDKKSPPMPLKRAQQSTQSPASERANLFSKRAGVDKIKYETLVKDIQGDSELSNDESFDGNFDLGNDYADPLSSNEIDRVHSLFDSGDDSAINFAELQKIQKLEQLAVTGSVGKIRRSQ